MTQKQLTRNISLQQVHSEWQSHVKKYEACGHRRWFPGRETSNAQRSPEHTVVERCFAGAFWGELDHVGICHLVPLAIDKCSQKYLEYQRSTFPYSYLL